MLARLLTLLLFLFSVVQTDAAFGSTTLLSPQATFRVDSTADKVDSNPGDGVCKTSNNVCTLRAAIQETNALVGDDTITLPAGTYRLTMTGAREDYSATGDLDIRANLAIKGAGARSTIIDGGSLDRVFDSRWAFAAVSISGVTIRNGKPTDSGGGGGIWNAVTLTLTGVTISGNEAIGECGGGITNAGALAITNSDITGNSAGRCGGGIAMFDGSISLDKSTVSDNKSWKSGGVLIGRGTATIRHSIISRNIADEGGGITVGGGIVKIESSTISDNVASSGSGGGLSGGGVITIADSLISKNTALNANGCCGVGGGGIEAAGEMTISHSVLSGNTTDANGGAIYNTANKLTIIQSTIAGNSAAGFGGGAQNSGQLVVLSSHISENTASTGGAIHNFLGKVRITDSILWGNSAVPDDTGAAAGGAVYARAGDIRIRKSCIVHNSDVSVYSTSSVIVDARGNWWGGSGPAIWEWDNLNGGWVVTGGTGDSVLKGGVDYGALPIRGSCFPAAPTPTPTPSPKALVVYGLGDSVASGHGLLLQWGTCKRALGAYPRLVHSALSDLSDYKVARKVRHYACSGARSDNLKPTDLQGQVDRTLKNLAKERKVRETTALVMLTIGANDFEWTDFRAFGSHFCSPEQDFNQWIDGVASQVQVNAEKELKRLVDAQDVYVIMTDYHNPFNHQSIIFRAFKAKRSPLFQEGCATLSLQEMYDRSERIIETLNKQLEAAASTQAGHVRIAKLFDRFHSGSGHESPRFFCGTAQPDSRDSWVQYPTDRLDFLLLLTHNGSDCFHPNHEGARKFAKVVSGIARGLLPASP